MRKISVLTSLVLIFALACGAALSASGAATKTKSHKTKAHTSLLGKLVHHKPTTGANAAAPAGAGQIIGDKNTHVYHLAGDKYTLPAEKNRVYFKTEAQAMAAGYRHAGSGAASGKKSMKTKKGASKATGHGHTIKSHKMKKP